MSFKTMVKQSLEAIEGLLRERDPLIQEYKTELARLRTQNGKLMDRLMAVDYEKYRTFTPEEAYAVPSLKDESEPSDDELAGEAIDVKE